MKKMTFILMFTHLICVSQHSKIENFKITILSTMLSDTHVGEWGFSALIEADGQKVLFDTGSREKTVIQNANELNINLNHIDNVFLSHNHKDHTGGLISLKKEFPNSFSKAHIGEGIFYSRPNSYGTSHYILNNKNSLESLGVKFITHINPSQIMKGLWTTAQIPRKYDSRSRSRL